MASNKTVNLLPEIFQTTTNKKFLAATLDQLTQEPNFKRSQGYVGRKVGPGVNLANNYITEPTKTRSDYQLEPGVTFLKNGTNTADDAITYPGMIDVLKLQDADVSRQDRLWQSQYYSWTRSATLINFLTTVNTIGYPTAHCQWTLAQLKYHSLMILQLLVIR
jgi:hypothetical protein